MTDIHIEEIPINKLKECDWNYKTDDDFIQEALINNLKRNGQIENLIVREAKGGKYEVVNGNHRLRALKTLDFKTAFCFNLGEITELEAKRIALETNETKFRSNEYSLAKLLEEIKNDPDMEDLNETLPYNELQLQAFEDLAQFDIESLDDDKTGKVDTKITAYFKEEQESEFELFLEFLKEHDIKASVR